MQRHLNDTITAEVDGVLVGLCIVLKAEVNQIYVSPQARGTGAADALMFAAEERMRTGGIPQAHLHVIPENTRAIAFYKRLGWTGETVTQAALETASEPQYLPVLMLTKQLV